MHYFERDGTAGVGRSLDDDANGTGQTTGDAQARLDLDEAREHLQHVDEPHAIIESLLSRGWGHPGAVDVPLHARRGVHVAKPRFCLRRDSVHRPGHADPWPEASEDRVPGWYSEVADEDG